jgi:TolA-binding protein
MNKIKSYILLSLIVYNSTSCTTQADIQREQTVDAIKLQMVQSQQHTGEHLVKLEDMQQQIAQLRGSIEEGGHQQKQTLKVNIKELEDRLLFVEESNKMLLENLQEIRTKVKEQKDFLAKVLKTLESAAKSPKRISKKKAEKKKSIYDKAMRLYKIRHYTKVKPILIELLKNKKIQGDKRARIFHNLGMIQFIKKKNKDALIYFSQLFTEHPKASYNANGLLYMAKAFKRLERKDETKQTLEELIKRYPKSKQVKEARSILKKL